MNGFTFDGKHSSKFSLIVNGKDVPITPPIDNRLQEISGFDGAWDYGISYSPRIIEVECTILSNSENDMKKTIRRFVGALNPRKGSKPLIFDDEPDVMYFARLSNQVPLAQLGTMGTFTLQFTCPDPFSYGVQLRSETISSYKIIDHNGTYISRPKLTVSHTGGAATIKNIQPEGTVETISFKDGSKAGTYIIDCKEYTITRNGEGAYNDVTGDFFSLIEGANRIENSSAITSTKIEFRDTWL